MIKDIFRIKLYKEELIKYKNEINLLLQEKKRLLIIKNNYLLNLKLMSIKYIKCLINYSKQYKMNKDKNNIILLKEKENEVLIEKNRTLQERNIELNELLSKYILKEKENNNKLFNLNQKYNDSLKEIKNENKHLKSLIGDKYYVVQNLEIIIKNLENSKKKYNFIIQNKKKEVQKLENLILELKAKKTDMKKDLIELKDEKLYQSFSLYEPMYRALNSDEYKIKINEIRKKQKEMLKNDTAAMCNTNWTLNGSISKGRVMTKNMIKQVIKCFNIECENIINKVKFNNIYSMKKRINSLFESLNKLNEKNDIEINNEYLKLKIKELYLVYEYEVIKQEEKEERKRVLDEKREEAKVIKEIEEKRKLLFKEESHYLNEISRVNDKLSKSDNISNNEYKTLQQKKEHLENLLKDTEVAIKEVDYREANKRAGYVYVISNIGSFGENIFKIGMTRRLNPKDRIDELSNASVPFKFDIHAMIFSDDAPTLESNIHKELENKKVNYVNSRKEFFNVSIEEIEKIIKKNYDKSVEFYKFPEAKQYRETLKLKEKIN